MQQARGRARRGGGRGGGRGRGQAADAAQYTLDNEDGDDDDNEVLHVMLPSKFKQPKSRKRARPRDGGEDGIALAERVADAMDTIAKQCRYAKAKSTSIVSINAAAQSACTDCHVCWQNYSGILAELGGHMRYDPSVHNGWTPMTSAWFAPSLIKGIPVEYNNRCYWKMCTENGLMSHMVLADGKVCLDVPLADDAGNWIRRDLCTRCWTYTNQNVMDKRPLSPLEFVLMCNKCAATASAGGFTTALTFAKRQRKYTPGKRGGRAAKYDCVLEEDDDGNGNKTRQGDDGQQDILVMFQKRMPNKT